MDEDNKLIEERREKLKALRARGVAFPNDFRPKHDMAELAAGYGSLDKPALEAQGVRVSVAGRMMLKRVMGKASFATLQDGTGRLQVYVSNDVTGAETHEQFKHWDLGDIVGVEGTLFKTNKGELTVQASTLRLLVKALRPLPEKVPRPRRPGDALPPALRRPDRHAGIAPRVRAALEGSSRRCARR
jgi:lysyl-tRNA synthetase class 2